MGSLFEELEAREAAARTRVEVLEAELAEVQGRLSAARARQCPQSGAATSARGAAKDAI